MDLTKTIVLITFIALLAVPMLFRPSEPRPPADAQRLIIITPHNEQIRYEFARAFDRWHAENYGERVNVIWSVPGGTSEIRRMLIAQFTAALEAHPDREPGGDADIVFGGGSYEHTVLKRGVTVHIDGQARQEPITQPVEFDDDWLVATYGENIIGDGLLYDPDKHWFGTALSGFGIVFNRNSLEQLSLPEPTYWEELCHPKLRGWVALVNPAQSGSITTAFDTILQRRGWERGWQIKRRAGANARYFSASALKAPTDVSQGNAAMGVCIDFFGRYQSQAILDAGGGDRIGYIDPPGATTIDADPISMLRGAPNPLLARRFIEFTLTKQGQALWQFSTKDEHEDGLGPERFELRRLPVLRSMYENYMDRMTDGVNAFEIAAPLEHPNPHFRSFVPVLFAAMAMDTHHDLQRAWQAIVTHPGYPKNHPSDRIVTADDEDITDPTLRKMLELFDVMPVIEGPEGRGYCLFDLDDIAALREGWLRAGWGEHSLWHPESTPADALRREAVRFFRSNYREIVRLADGKS
jgi:iron(III) transport system substrate-binding protein